MDLMQRNGSHLKMYDEVIALVNDSLNDGSIGAGLPPLLNRASFLKRVESNFKTQNMKPTHTTVKLANGSLVTVSTFDVEFMIRSMLADEELMHPDNIAEGYDLHTGHVDPNCPANEKYGEIHTGDAWEPAMFHYCGADGKYMPIALVVFGDKTHTDLHGSLSVTPLIFTLSCFNKKARNNPNFWRPLAYIPNLSHGKGKSDKTESAVKVQDEHRCLALAFKSIEDLHKRNTGIRQIVMGKLVTGVVWIHFFIGDTQGNNTWLGHYNGSGKLKLPYRDCLCRFIMMSAPNPKCTYVTLDDMRNAKRKREEAPNEKEKKRFLNECRNIQSQMHLQRWTYHCQIRFTDHIK